MALLRACVFATGWMLALAGSSTATPLAYEDFSYAYGELDGGNGGMGFGGAWSANTAFTEIADPGIALSYSGGAALVDGGSSALRVTGNANNLAFRDLASPIVADEVFVSFLFRYDGILNDNDFAVLWHDNVSTGSHTTRPNLGIKANQGNGAGSEDVVARLQLGGSGQVYAVDLVAGQTYFILGRLHRSAPGAGNVYDRFDVWVDPTAGASGAPDLTAAGAGGVSSFGTIGIRTANIDAVDTFWIDEIRYAATFEAAVVPEPSIALLMGAGLAALSTKGRSRRSPPRRP